MLIIQRGLNSILRLSPLLDPLIYAARLTLVQQYYIFFFSSRFENCHCCYKFLSYRNRQSLALRSKSAASCHGVPLENCKSNRSSGSRRMSNLLSKKNVKDNNTILSDEHNTLTTSSDKNQLYATAQAASLQLEAIIRGEASSSIETHVPALSHHQQHHQQHNHHHDQQGN